MIPMNVSERCCMCAIVAQLQGEWLSPKNREVAFTLAMHALYRAGDERTTLDVCRFHYDLVRGLDRSAIRLRPIDYVAGRG